MDKIDISVSSKEESDMRKMRTPEIDVIRFTESDVIVASAKTITVAGLGDPDNVSATFKMGANTWDSNTIVNAGSDTCKDMMNAYAGGETDGRIYVGNAQIPVFGLALDDYYGNDKSEQYSVINGTYVWNGNAFKKKS